MSGEYISNQEFQTFLEDLIIRIEDDEDSQIEPYLRQLLEECRSGEQYIDRTYISRRKDQRRKTLITEITTLLQSMDDVQLENIRVYTVDEHAEPNHEAAALNAIIQLSREQGKRVN